MAQKLYSTFSEQIKHEIKTTMKLRKSRLLLQIHDTVRKNFKEKLPEDLPSDEQFVQDLILKKFPKSLQGLNKNISREILESYIE